MATTLSQSIPGGGGVDSSTQQALWRRLLAPSFSDLLFLSLIVWLFVAGRAGWLALLVDGDTGWHIRTGEWILEHRTVPTVDLFSYSKAGAPWFAWEWLADVLFAVLHRETHFKGILLLSGLAIAGSGLLVFRRMLWRGASLLVSLPLALLGVSCSTVHYLARPHVLTLLFLAVSMWMIDADRKRPAWHIWLLVPLTALWTNVHGGFMALIACLGLLAAGTGVENWLAGPGEDRWRPVRRYVMLAGACALATLVNPYGWQLHWHVLGYLGSDWIRKSVEEFQSPAFRNEAMLHFEGLLFLGLLAAGRLLQRRRIVEALWILFWAHASLGSVRHLTVFVVVASPVIAGELTALWDALRSGRSRKSLVGIFDAMSRDLAPAFRRTTVWTFVPVLVLALVNPPVPWPVDFPDIRFPVKAIERYPGVWSQYRILTSDQWGDYLIYRFHPNVKVFFDGRSDFYGQALGEQYLGLATARWDWERLMQRHGFEVALLPASWALVSALKRHPDWKLLYDDGRAVLFVRAPLAEKIGAVELMKSGPPAERHSGAHQG